MTKLVEKEIDRHSDVKLERIKAELQGSYSTLKTSVEVLTSANSGMQSHIVEAAIALWSDMIAMRDHFNAINLFDNIVLAAEAAEAFEHQSDSSILEMVMTFSNTDQTEKLISNYLRTDVNKQRLFCGDRLWLIFSIYRSLIIRSTYLINMSFVNKSYEDWRNDSGIAHLLRAVLEASVVQQIEESEFGGLNLACVRLEGEFLHEAARVMSGSKVMADSLGDMQAIMLLQNASVTDYKRLK